MDTPLKRLTQEERQYVQSALERTLSENFPSYTDDEVTGIATWFRTQMCRVIMKYPSYIKDRSFGQTEMRDAFAEVLKNRILHKEEEN